MDVPLPLPESQPPKQPTRQVLMALAIVVLAILAAAIWNRPERNPAPAPSAKTQNTTPSPVPDAAPDISLAFLFPDAFVDRDRAQRFVNESQGKRQGNPDYETIVAGIVPDAMKADDYYFAMAGVATTPKGRFVGVYRYNTKTTAWHRLYKTTFPLE